MKQETQSALRKWRLDAGLTVADAAEKAKVTRQTWHSWESGRSIPPARYMLAIKTMTDGAVKADDFYPSEQAAA